MPTIAQIRAARALLNWNQEDLAKAAGLSQTGIARIENGSNKPTSTTLEKIESAFDRANVEFIGGGVRTIKDKLIVFEGTSSLKQLQDDIYHYCVSFDQKEVLILGLFEIDEAEKDDFEYSKMHIERLISKGISERIIVSPNEQSFIAPSDWYRSIDKKYFSPHAIFIYGSRIALNLREPEYKTLILDNPFFAQNMTVFFDFLWDKADRRS